MRLTLRKKLLFLILSLIIVANLTLGTITHRLADQGITESVETTVMKVADQIADKVNAVNQAELNMLHGIANLPFIADEKVSTKEKCHTLTNIALANPAKYTNVTYYDEKGISYPKEKPEEAMDFSSREYFRVPMSGKEYIGDPFKNAVTGASVMIYSVPVRNKNGKIIGIVASVCNGDFLDKLSAETDCGGGMHPGIMDMSSGETIGNSNAESAKAGSNISQLDKNTEFYKVFEKVISGQTGVSVFTDPFIKKKMISSYKPIGNGTDWVVFCAAPFDFYFNKLTKIQHAMTIILAVTIVAAAALAATIIALLLKPLRALRTSIEDIASGNADLTRRLEKTSDDEIGDITSSFNEFIKKLQSIIGELKSTKNHLTIAGEDLEASTQDTSASIHQIIESINSVNGQINSQADSVHQTAGAVNEIASNIESLEHMIENQGQEIQQASAAVEQMIGNISSVNKSVDLMAGSFDQLSQNANNGAQLQMDVNEKIEQIKNQSETLQEANLAISAIAEQTNLLAMNAAIEAAHAGEAGKGFSVVADEIRKLSETSSAQSKTIGDELNNIRSSIESVVEASQESSKAFQSVTAKIQETDELVRQIKAAMEEQTEGSNQINAALHSMNDSTVEVRTASREMSEGNKQILNEVRNLQDASGSMTDTMREMTAGATKIKETGIALTGIAEKMQVSISDIGSQVDQFKV